MAGIDIRSLHLSDLLDKEAVLFNPGKNIQKARGIVFKTTEERFKQYDARYALIARKEGRVGYFFLKEDQISHVDHSTYPPVIHMGAPYFWEQSVRHSRDESTINDRLRLFYL